MKNHHWKRIVAAGLSLLMIYLTGICALASSAEDLGPGSYGPEDELRGIWISYLEWEKLPSGKADFEKQVNLMLDNCVSYGMNAVFVHVRSNSDAMYPSQYFPWSKFVTGTQGEDPGYDPLKFFINAAHLRNLEFHAWVSPYRITGYLNRWGDLADTNPAKVWLTDKDTSNDRWVLKHDGEYYYNPAIPEVRELIINGVKELVWNYDVDGIQFDDLFYPTVNDERSDLCFDKPEYVSSKSRMSISNWRRNNVNRLIRDVYSAIKELGPAVQFGVSSEGYIANLESNNRLFVDVNTWMSRSGYVDYMMPQLYWGFEAKGSDRKAAPYAFEQNLTAWTELQKKGSVQLYLGLAMYKTATDAKDNNNVSEWLRYNNIMQRQVETGRRNKSVNGYCFYSYSSFQRKEAQTEVTNLKKVLK